MPVGRWPEGLRTPPALSHSTHGLSRFRNETVRAWRRFLAVGGLSDRCSQTCGDLLAGDRCDPGLRLFRCPVECSSIETPYRERRHSLVPWPTWGRRYGGRSIPRPTRHDSSRARGLETRRTVKP